MKKLLNIFLPLTLFWMLTASRCKKDILPPETQEGKNTFGCYVNGELFVPRGSGLGSIKTCFYQFIYPAENGYVFYAGGRRDENNEGFTKIAIGFDSLQLEANKTYKLVNVGRGNAYGSYSFAASPLDTIQNYNTSEINTGELLVKKFDNINHIVSGTFWFTVIKNNGETVHITDGRFDMPFTR